MTELTEAANHIATRAARIAKLVTAIEAHLLAEQMDAISALPESASAPREHRPSDATGGPSDDPDAMTGTVGYSDRTPVLAARMGFYRRRHQIIVSALGALNRQLDKAEKVMSAILAVRPDVNHHAEPVCPGWTDELRARLGGCGKVREKWRRADGTDVSRDYCSQCRRESDEHDRASEDVA